MEIYFLIIQEKFKVMVPSRLVSGEASLPEF
jgi:hypothetical protein